MTCFPSFVWFGRPRARRCGNVSANRTKGWVGTRVRIRTLEKNVSATSTSPKLTGEKTWGRWRRKRKDVSRLARQGAAGERARASLKSPIRGERRKIQKPGTVDETATYLSGLVGGRGHPGGDPLRVEGERLFPARRRRVGAGDASRRPGGGASATRWSNPEGVRSRSRAASSLKAILAATPQLDGGRPRRSPSRPLENECKGPESKG